MPGDPFQIDIPPIAPFGRAAPAVAVARLLLEWALDLKTYRNLYREVQARGSASFESRVLQVLNIAPDISSADLSVIPCQGPLIVAANHPHGALDGLLMADVVGRIRSDVRVLTNHVLARIPELHDLCFFVDPFEGPQGPARSRAGVRAAYLWLRGGGTLVMFPSGEVAHERGLNGSRADSVWKPAVGRMAATTGAQVLPAFIEGANRRAFYAAGRIHPLLRTLLLGRELLSKRGQTIAVRLSAPVSAGATAHAAISRRVRRAVDRLANMKSTRLAGACADAVGSEVARLPPGSCLLESGPFQVFCTDAKAIPETLREIGRLREVTFRAVGEGTGGSLDLDGFDVHYRHLFLWKRDTRQVIGAYRIGQTDRIVAERGIDGLYTRTLFRYDDRLIRRFGAPALELGRSFVRSEYQRNYNALLLLWKGIGQFLARHPRYRVLFGPVSISARYSDTSHRLLMAFLWQNHFNRELADLVEAVDPTRIAPPPDVSARVPQSIDAVNRLVAQTERDGKGVPVLLRQYLKLNARLLGFAVDPAFGDALDALMMVDLTTVDPAILNRYLGRTEAAQFLAYHQQQQSVHAA